MFRFYLATDERNATHLEYFSQNGAVFINDLITAEDRRDMDAWSLVFTDVVGVLEQTMLARSSFFFGHALSSVAGSSLPCFFVHFPLCLNTLFRIMFL